MEPGAATRYYAEYLTNFQNPQALVQGKDLLILQKALLLEIKLLDALYCSSCSQEGILIEMFHGLQCVFHSGSHVSWWSFQQA